MDDRRSRMRRTLKRTDEDVTDIADNDNEANNPLDKSDSFRLDVGNTGGHDIRRNILNILPSNESTENNMSVSDSCKTSVADEEDIQRESGYLEVSNVPHMCDVDNGDGHKDVDTDLVHYASRSPRLPICNSKLEQCQIHQFQSLKEVCQAIKDAGVTECHWILGIDYTLSNIMQGQKTFGGRCLHDVSPNVVNPYKESICIFGETLEDLKSDDAEIPVFGFGKKLVRLKPQEKCTDFGDVLSLYEEFTQSVKLGGPTDFSPVIYESIKIVERTKKFHVLLIICDGQITKEEETIAAIIDASNYALSIVVVGVGDGPWDVMHDFDDKLPERKFDNFHFVEFHRIKKEAKNPETEVALMALMEIPLQFKSITALQLLDNDDELNNSI